jgi:lycopene beta-cyclase
MIGNRIKTLLKLPLNLSRQERIGFSLIGVWLLVMIAFPIGLWTIGESIIPAGITIAAIVQASAVFYIVQSGVGLRRALLLFAIVALVTWSAEALGSKTGFPFGDYYYTDILQPQLWGVPLLIPLSWWMLLPSAWVIAQVIVGEHQQNWQKRLQFVAISALALTAWDLFLDPQMVGWQFWIWREPSGYYGIPWSNYVGWLLVSSLVTFIANPPRLPILPMATVYACVWFLQSIGLAVFWGQPAPSLWGCLGMGAMMIWAYWRYKGTQK